MGIAPAYAVPKALAKAGKQIGDMDLIEINEAFAAQVLACGLKLQWDWNKVNVNGGAIALGHPVGSSGCRIVVTLVHEMKRRHAHYGLATLCAAGGQGAALVVEECEWTRRSGSRVDDMPTHPLIDPGEVRFFSGSSNRPLAAAMARQPGPARWKTR